MNQNRADSGAVFANANGFPVADLRDFLRGRWRIDRTITDRLHGADGRLVGLAEFAPDGDGLAYVETGRLALPGYEGEAEQRHRYRFPAPGRAEVYFRDGGYFHDLDLTRGEWQADHPCGADLYRGWFRALGPDAWRQVWTVVGPRKDLRLAAEFVRLPTD